MRSRAAGPTAAVNDSTTSGGGTDATNNRWLSAVVIAWRVWCGYDRMGGYDFVDEGLFDVAY
jgi:hypothetical protein